MSKFLGYAGILTRQRFHSTTMDLISKIPELNQKHVHIKNPDRLNKILSECKKDGHEKLQVVSDFDQTITKQHENGKRHMSSFGMFDHCPSLDENYKKTVKELNEKYYPLEVDPTIPLSEKYKLMEEWWIKSEEALKGVKITHQEIEEICQKLGPSLRDGSKKAFELLSKENVPVLVFSAGLGDTVQTVLKQQNVLLPNVKVVSNFLKYNEDGTVAGFQSAPIHVFNKNEYAIQNTDFYKLIIDRTNVILMGDSLGDANMADGITHVENIIKIGYLYERKEEALPDYLDTFDIVLEDDQTMEVFYAILKCIFEGN